MELAKEIDMLQLHLSKYKELLQEIQDSARTMVEYTEMNTLRMDAEDAYRDSKAQLKHYGILIRKEQVKLEKALYPVYAGLPFLEEVYE